MINSSKNQAYKIGRKGLMLYYSYMDSRIRKTLGDKIKTVREKAKLTQAEVARDADIHVNYLSRIERGEENPTTEVLQKLAKALKVKSSEILPF